MNITSNPIHDYGQPDVDKLPKVYVCFHCARDVKSGEKCICIPSQPFSRVKSLTISANR